jgi:tetratricopeptide (TPR) repeat protein
MTALSKAKTMAGDKPVHAMTEQKPPKSPPWLKRLGGRIRQVRRIRGLTQTDVAKPNLTKSFISLLESGRTYPSVGTLVALANRLQTSLALLLLETSELPRETALTLFTLARAMGESSPAEADRLLDAAEVLTENVDDLQADLILTRGDIALSQGKPKEAERLYDDMLSWARKRKLRAYEARALAKQALLVVQRGDDAGARPQLEEALQLFRSTRTLRSVEGCEAMLAFAQILGMQGRTTRMMRILEEVAQVARRQDLPLILGRTELALARAHLAAGQSSHAKEALQTARGALESSGETPEVAQWLRSLGTLFVETGAAGEAHAVLQAALRMQDRLGDLRHRAPTLNDLARVLLQQGKLTEAQSQAKEALDLADNHHQSIQKAQVLVTMALIAKSQRRWRQAIDQLREAVELFRKGKQTADVAATARELGMLLKERGEHAEAADYLAMAIATERPPRK